MNPEQPHFFGSSSVFSEHEPKQEKDHDLIEYLKTHWGLADDDTLPSLERGDAASAIDKVIVPACETFMRHGGTKEEQEFLERAIKDLLKNHKKDLIFGSDKVIEEFLKSIKK